MLDDDEETVMASNVSLSPHDNVTFDEDPWDPDPEDRILNAISTNVSAWTSNDDIEYDEPAGEDIDINVPRAQIDTGTVVSCTDQLHMLHDYKPFSKENPCPVRLLPALKETQATPQGSGFLHVPAHNDRGYLAVKTYYHPLLRATVIDERDFVRAAGETYKNMQSETIHKYHSKGIFEYVAVHKRKKSHNIVVRGVLRYGKCFTGPLIPPILSGSNKKAVPSNSIDIMKEVDPIFRRDCEIQTIQNIHAHQLLLAASLI